MTNTVSQPNNQSTSSNPVGRFMVAVGAVIEHKPTGTILITKRSASQDWKSGEWEIGYGRIAQFEDPEMGLKREVMEETGIADLQVGRVLRAWHLLRGTEKLVENDLIGITYHCVTHSNIVTLSAEHEAYQWLLPEHALSYITNPGIRSDVELFIALQAKNIAYI